MKKYAIFLMFLGACAQTQNVVTWDPPTRYSQEYSGNLSILKLNQRDVVSECKNLMNGLNVDVTDNMVGCARYWISPAKCTLVMIDKPYIKADGNIITENNVYKHELGHCNEWSEDHPS